MIVRRALLVLCLVLLPVSAFAVVGADMGVTASHSPDPVAPDGNITYTVHVTNAGLSTATTAHFSAILGGTLLFQSITVPSGWTCPAIAVGSGASFTCTAATLASGSNDVFTVVLNAGLAQQGVLDHTIPQLFTVNATESDPNNGNNSVTVNTSYVAPHVDMAITATDSPDPVNPDGNITYTINVLNNGPDPATTAHFSVVLNGTLLFQSMTAPAGWTCPAVAVGSGASFTCTAATLAASTTSPFTVVLKAGVAQFGVTNQTINELFGVNSPWFDPNNANNAVTVQTSYVVPVADIGVTNSDSPDPVHSGSTITYTQTVTNNGPDTATNVHLTEGIASGATFQSLTAAAGFNCTKPAVGGTGFIDCTSASMANGASASFTIVVNVTAASGLLTNTAVGSSDAADNTQANNSAVATTTVLAPASADLGITKSTLTTNAAAGAPVTYTIAVTNHGPDAATAVTMTDVLPASLKFQSLTAPGGFSCTTPAVGATGTISCIGASLANGATATFTLVVTSVSNANGAIANTASVSGTPSDPSSGNNSATSSFTAGSADLSVGGTATPNGSTITYVFTVTNSGPDGAVNPVFTDTLPSSLLFQSIIAPGWTCTTPAVGTTGPISCTASSLGAGGTGTFTIVTTVAPGTTGMINNGAGVSSGTSDPNGGNSTTSAPSIAAPVSANVPALSTWTLMLLAAILGLAALLKVR